MPRIGFLHTSAAHTETFEHLVARTDASVDTVTVVDEKLLADARRHGPKSAIVRAAVNAALDQLVESGANTIVCTCSTVAGQAEAEGLARSVDVLRVDRPMAAVAAGRRITVLAALESTLGRTTDLLHDVAAARGADIELMVQLCEGAWECFERGDLDAYWAIVAAACDAAASMSDAIVLAQASMAGAAALCTVDVPVLSSPLPAVEAAIKAGRTQQG